MRVLIDECVPRALKKLIVDHGHQCRTVQESGWAGKQNGELLSLMESDFDALVTLDTNLRYQQNLTGHKIAIVVLQCSSNRLEHLRPLFPRSLSVLDKIKPGEILFVGGA